MFQLSLQIEQIERLRLWQSSYLDEEYILTAWKKSTAI